MAGQWEIASTIGTWVAVILAIAALGGLLGPFLIWRASQTERHQALDLLEKGEAENGGYVSKGLRVSRKIRLFRQVYAPLLQEEPQLPGRTLTKVPVKNVSQKSAGWVQFCIAISSYGLRTSKGDSLILRAGRTWLPMHKNWILIMGIVGRFAKRPDRGKLPLPAKGRLRSMQALPGRAFQGIRKLDSANGDGFLQNRWLLNPPGYGRRHEMIDDEEDRFSALHGLFGTLWTGSLFENQSEPSKAYYTEHKITETGELSGNALTIGNLFWLSVGCLPMDNGNIYCLENVSEIVGETIPQAMPMERGDENAYITDSLGSRNAHFEVDTDSSSSSDFTRRRRIRDERHRANYVIPTSVRKNGNPKDPRVFRFSTSNDRVEALNSVANSLEATDARGVVYSLEEIELPSDAKKELDESVRSTYHPINGAWVRLGKDSNSSRRTEGAILTFIERQSAHIIAKALLDIPVSADGYLMPCNQSSLCRATLCNAAQSFPHLISRMANDLGSLFIPAEDQRKTVALFDKFLGMCHDFKPDRAFFHTLSELDSVLSTFVSPDLKANTAIGVIMLTSAEFRDLIAQSARLIPQSKDKVVVLEVSQLPTLNIPSSMGVVQKFPIDRSVICLDQHVSTEIIEIKYHHLLFGALKACLRSVLLDTSLDSTPLFEAFMAMGEIVHMG
jgi:hypothetical protein